MAVAPDAPMRRPPVHSLAFLASLMEGAVGPTTPTAGAPGVAAAAPVIGDRAPTTGRAAPAPSARPAKKDTTDGREPAIKPRAGAVRVAVAGAVPPLRPRAVNVTKGLELTSSGEWPA